MKFEVNPEAAAALHQSLSTLQSQSKKNESVEQKNQTERKPDQDTHVWQNQDFANTSELQDRPSEHTTKLGTFHESEYSTLY